MALIGKLSTNSMNDGTLYLANRATQNSVNSSTSAVTPAFRMMNA
jgi:hypothetical protein